MRQAVAAADTKIRSEWDRQSFALCWVLNMMPNFSKKKRRPIRLHQLNPFLKRQNGRPSGMSDDQLERALDRMAERDQRNG